MEMPKYTCSFKGGMNKDISVNEYPNTCYQDAKNLRVIVDESSGTTTASLATPKGNAVAFTLPDSTFYLGSTTLRDNLVILAKDTTPALLRPDKVYVIGLSHLDTAENITVGGSHLVYEQYLGFNLNYPIRVVGNYENADVQKIYWVDGLNPLRHLNIINNAETNPLSTLDPELLNILPNHTYGSYTLSELIGGHLKAGRIQYSYQLYSISGTETMFAPPSSLYNLTSSGAFDGINFVGSEIEAEIDKSIKVEITLGADVESTFNRIRLVALEYETYGDVPTVRVVAELELGSSTISFVDSGNSIAELVLEEFQAIRNEITPATIETKNNYLFAANITQEQFDIDDLAEELNPLLPFLDTRAYRWRYVETGGGSLSYGFDTLTEATDPTAIGDAMGTGYGLDCFQFTPVQLYETAWELNIHIGAVAHATALGRTVTGISSINGVGSNLHLRHIEDASWTTGGGLTLDLDGVTIQSWDGINTLKIRGDKWIYSPDDLMTNYGHTYATDFDARALTEFSYTYTYSEVAAGPAKYECVINKVDALLDPPGTWPMRIIDDGFGGGPQYDFVEEKNDCINTYNNILNDTITPDHHQFKFKYGLAGAPTYTGLGGTGRYVSYEFLDTTDVDVHGADLVVGSKGALTVGTDSLYYVYPGIYSYFGYGSPQIIMDHTGYQRDEVYRFAIVFYDLKGRPSFSKWIADIRFPNVNEYLHSAGNSDYYEITPVDPTTPLDVMIAKALGIKFTINWVDIETNYPGMLAQLSGFQIVRSQRTDNDCTIKAQGIIVPTHHPDVPVVGKIRDSDYSTYNITGASDYSTDTVTAILDPIVTNLTGTDSSLTDHLVELLSPEMAIGRDLTVDSGVDFLEIVGHLDNVTLDTLCVNATKQKGYAVVAMTVNSLTTSPALIADHRKTINDALVSYPETKYPTSHTIGSTSYTARGYDDTLNTAVPEMTYKSTSLVAEISSPFLNVSGASVAGDEKAMYGRYRRPLGYSIYGGATYVERSYSTYIDVSGFKTTPTVAAILNYKMFGGDTYITPFNFLKLFYDYSSEYAVADGQNSGQVIVAFPMESRLNLAYKLDNIPRYLTTALVTPIYYLAEKQSIGISQYPNGYPNIGDLYRYNSAYSTESISKIFSPKPFDYRAVDINDVMVTSSEKKYNGEYSDSWLKFKFNNYIELEGEYGAITRIINHSDKLMAFQPRAIAVLSVLERELVETNNVAALAVGTGGILSRYDYLTRKAGTSLYDAITPADIGLYFYDDKNITIYRILESLEAISDTKGMKSYFELDPVTSLVASYDRDNREVLFTPRNTFYFGALELTFDNIINVPVANASSVTDWNTFFDLPTNGTPFTSVVVDGNTIKLYGGSGITLKNGIFLNNINITYVNDEAGCIIIGSTQAFSACTEITGFNLPALTDAGFSQMFYGCELVSVFSFPSLTKIGGSCFQICTGATIFNFPLVTTLEFTGAFRNCSNANSFYLPLCTQMGMTVGDNIVFQGITGKTITLTIPASLMVCNGGNPDGDIATLQANNTVTVTQSDPTLVITGDTLVFSGYTDAFTGFYTLGSGTSAVRNYITFDKYLLSSLDGRTFYLHNCGNYNEYYGEHQESSLTLIANPNKTQVCTFHAIQWLADLTTSGVETPADLLLTFDTLQVTNTHQDTGVMTLLTRDDLKRRFRKWRMNLLRDSGNNGRLRDSWVKCTFTWLQTNDHKKLVIHPINFSFIPVKM